MLQFDEVTGVPVRGAGSKNRLALPLALAAALPIVGCGDRPPIPSAPTRPETTGAVAVVHPTEGHRARGTVSFREEADGVRITVNLTGLEPGEHGFHVHQRGDCSAADGTSAGGHYNPDGNPHGRPDSPLRHAGDLGNVTADAQGVVTAEFLDSVITLNGANSIIGRGVIVHEGPDDFTTQPTGAAGARQSCGVIGDRR